MNKGKEKLNDTEKREEKERYDRRSEIITVDPHSTSMGGVSAGIEETRRQEFTRWKPISADWYLHQRYHRGPTLYHVAPRLSGRVFICSNRARLRDTILLGDPSDVTRRITVTKLYGFSEGEAE